MFLDLSVIFILVFKLTQKCTSLPFMLLLFCYFSIIIHYLISCFCHQSHSYKTHTVFSPLVFTLLISVAIYNLTLSSVFSSINYILSSVISSNTFIQSSNTNTSSISSIVTAVEICDEVGFLQSATHVYLKNQALSTTNMYLKNLSYKASVASICSSQNCIWGILMELLCMTHKLAHCHVF